MTAPPPLSAQVHGKTVDERETRGKAARSMCSRAQLGEFEPAADRPHAWQILESQESVRVPELLPLRHSRMAQNPFAFMRGAAAVMAHDLGQRPNSGLNVQMCGDAHLSNLGLFAGPDRRLLFDINDFDETLRGPFEWDVLRLASSFPIAAQLAGHGAAFAQTLPAIVASAYQDAMGNYSRMSDLDVWYYRLDTDQLRSWANKDEQAIHALHTTEKRARAKDRWSAVRSLTEVTPYGRRFKNQPPLLVSLGEDPARIPVVMDMFDKYLSTLLPDRSELLGRYHVVDVGHKVVGVGSVGLLAFVLLLQGRDDDDLLVIQIKEAVGSVYEPFVDHTPAAPHGRRVVLGQQLMQAASDAFLGWVDGPNGRAFYVRQLRDMKWSPDPARMTKRAYSTYAALCGAALARAHARAGDAIAISAYIGSSTKFADSVARFAQSYQRQNDADYAEFMDRVHAGDISLATNEGDNLKVHLSDQGHVVVGT